METLKKFWNTIMYADKDYEPWDLIFVTVLAFTTIFMGADVWIAAWMFIILFPITYRSVVARLAQRKAAKVNGTEATEA